MSGKPKTGQYTKSPADLIRSPMLRKLPQRALCVVWAVLDEHNRKGGKENGNLIVPYKTLKIWLGTSDKTAIALSIKQVRACGLLAAIEGRFNSDGTREPTRFRVTWLPGHNGGPSSDEWREITGDEQALEILKSLKGRRRKSARYKAAELAGQLGTNGVRAMTTANKEAPPIILNINWIVRAPEREHELQHITPGRPLKVSYSKLLAYCPQGVINAANRAGHPDFIAITACLELAEEHKLIIVELGWHAEHRWHEGHRSVGPVGSAWRCHAEASHLP